VGLTYALVSSDDAEAADGIDIALETAVSPSAGNLTVRASF